MCALVQAALPCEQPRWSHASVWGAGCRQRRCPAVAVPDRSGPQGAPGVLLISKKKAQKTAEQGVSNPNDLMTEQNFSGELMGSLPPRPRLPQCLQPLVLHSGLIGPQPNEDARTCSQAPPQLLTLRAVSSGSTNIRKRGREKRVLFPILFVLKGWMLRFLVN